MLHILRCHRCGAYTFKTACACGGPAGTSRPPKYSPQDKFGDYRRKTLRPGLEQRGIL